jgi:hypothetical protein
MVVGKLKTEQGAGVSKSSSRAHLQWLNFLLQGPTS